MEYRQNVFSNVDFYRVSAFEYVFPLFSGSKKNLKFNGENTNFSGNIKTFIRFLRIFINI